MNYKKYCTLDKNDNFIAAFDTDQINSLTIFSVPPKISENVVAKWRYPGWSYNRVVKRDTENVDIPTSKRISTVNTQSNYVLPDYSKKEKLLNSEMSKYLKIRLSQFKKMIVLCFEKYEIPQNVIDAKDIMIDYLEDAKNEKLSTGIKIIEVPVSDDLYEEPDENTSVSEEAPPAVEVEVTESLQVPEPVGPMRVDGSADRINNTRYQVVYSFDKIFPKLERYITETPLSINCFLEYVQEKNGVIAHPYNDVSEIDS